ncbi:MAG: hypothetical protein J0J14_00295, partial [Hyphomicrobium sp.]|nr:hypothetical protein [Hyphomicrobium sp.]
MRRDGRAGELVILPEAIADTAEDWAIAVRVLKPVEDELAQITAPIARVVTARSAVHEEVAEIATRLPAVAQKVEQVVAARRAIPDEVSQVAAPVHAISQEIAKILACSQSVAEEVTQIIAS